MHLEAKKITVSGGGANSKEWIQIFADVLGQEIYITQRFENACLCAAMLVGIGIRKFKGIEEACQVFIKQGKNIVSPINKNIAIYNNNYKIFQELYKSNKNIYKKL